MGLYLSEEERAKKRKQEEIKLDIESIKDISIKLKIQKKAICNRIFEINQHKNNAIKYIGDAIRELEELEKVLTNKV